MKIYSSVEEFGRAEVKIPVVTTGTFDGVHIGHKAIIERLKVISRKIKGETVLLTFHPHPRMVLHSDDSELKLLNTLEEKITLLEQTGIDHLIIHPFTKKFSRLSSLEFVREILVNTLKIKKLVIGYNHHFGRNREGSFEHLKEYGPVYGFEVEEIPAKEIDQVNVSSTKIRKALMGGNVSTANKYLGYMYPLSGTVVSGSRIGNTIGFPTANLQVNDPNKLIPGNGVYAVKTFFKEQAYNGMLNIGFNPTAGQDRQKSIEVHLFDFDKNIYDQTIQVCFVKKLRDEKKFDDMESLRHQLEIDKNKSLNLLV